MGAAEPHQRCQSVTDAGMSVAHSGRAAQPHVARSRAGNKRCLTAASASSPGLYKIARKIYGLVTRMYNKSINCPSGICVKMMDATLGPAALWTLEEEPILLPSWGHFH